MTVSVWDLFDFNRCRDKCQFKDKNHFQLGLFLTDSKSTEISLKKSKKNQIAEHSLEVLFPWKKKKTSLSVFKSLT